MLSGKRVRALGRTIVGGRPSGSAPAVNGEPFMGGGESVTSPARVPTHVRVTRAPKAMVSIPVTPEGSPGPRTFDEHTPHGYVALRHKYWIAALAGRRAAPWPERMVTRAPHSARRPHHPDGGQSTAAGSVCAPPVAPPGG